MRGKSILQVKFIFDGSYVCIVAHYKTLDFRDVSVTQNLSSPKQGKIIDDPQVGYIIIRVTDSGPGLSLEQQHLMFGEGVQFNPNELQAGQGSGLGMWISKEIVNLHEGEISVSSPGLGYGATFEVVLPVVLRDPSNQALVNPKESDLQSPELVSPPHVSDSIDNVNSFSSPRQAEPLRVLVVDDAASNRKLVCRLLQSKGFVCEQAENGEECVQKVMAGDHHYDIILLDYEMPVMNGPTAARQLRQMKVDSLIIGVTGNALPEDKEFFVSQGATTVLTKPINIDELVECINHNQGVKL